MFKILLRQNLYALVKRLSGIGRKSGKKSGKSSVILYVILLLYVLGVFAMLFYQLFNTLAEPLAYLELGWLYFVYVFIVAFAIMFIMSVFSAKGQLYEAKDNDLLLSMPIKPGAILGSRMAGLIALELIFELLVVVPAGIVWIGTEGVTVTAASVISYVILCLCLSLLCMAPSALFGWLLSILSSKTNNKTLFEVIASVIFLAVYFYVYSQINTYITSIIMNSEAIAAKLGAVAPLYWIGNAAETGNPLRLLLAVIIMLTPFAAAYLILSATFIKTATVSRSSVKKKYEDKGQKVSGVGTALFNREMRRMLTSSTYIMNGCLGAIFILVAAAALVIKSDELGTLVAQIGIGTEYVLPVCILIIGFMGGTMQPTSASVSLEGSSLWVIQSLPVEPAAVLRAKLHMDYAVFLPPTLLCELALIYAFRPSAILSLMVLLIPLLMLVLMALIGLAINLKHPMLEWTTEAEPLKRGAAVLLSMLSDFGLLAVLGLGGFFLLNAGVSVEITLLIVLVSLIASVVLLYLWIIRKGTAIFSRL